MSFASDAAVVGNEALTVAERLTSLKHCVTRFHPLGYQATMRHLERATGADSSRWTGEQLRAAIAELEAARSRWLDFQREWDHERRRRKAAGDRAITPSERAQLDAMPWLVWPRPQPVELRRHELAATPMPFRRGQLADYDVVIGSMAPGAVEWHGSFEVAVLDEQLRIPGRIYNPEPTTAVVESLSKTQRTMLHCLYTRHHDGYVRQRHVAHLLDISEPWVIPYVVALVGEYVVEIVDDIRAKLDELGRDGSEQQIAYGRFVANNPAFMAITAQRVHSYWQAYYTQTHGRALSPQPRVDPRPIYPGFDVLRQLHAAARSRGEQRRGRATIAAQDPG